MYTLEEVKRKTLKYFKGDELATTVWIDKYCLKDEEGNCLELTPDDMHKRLAKEFARIEAKYSNPLSEKEIYKFFKDFKYIVPQGRIASGLGDLDSFKSLSNCLVLPSPKDSYNSIMRTDTMAVSAAKRGCGYGIDLSNLRPKGSTTVNAAKTSAGIVPFMERYSNSTREVGQNSRRGACLLGMDITHPQSVDFLSAKKDRTKITGANISLKIPNYFFENLLKDGKINLEFNGKTHSSIKSRTLWDKLIERVLKDSEPGIFMWDKINNYDPASVYKNHQITLSNACGEQPMSEFDSCRLIVHNLYSIVNGPFTENSTIDWKLFKQMVNIISRLSDDIVDLEVEYIDRILNKIKADPEPTSEKTIELELWDNIKYKALAGRRTGMGITGLGDMLAALGIKYGSPSSFKVIEEVFSKKLQFELECQITLAKERGTFPDWNPELENSKDNEFYDFLKREYENLWEQLQKHGRRSINWNTISPTGTTSLMTQTTSGCEPCYQIYYTRRRKVEGECSNITFKDKNGDCWEEYKVLHPKFETWIEQSGNTVVDDNYPRLIEISPYKGSVAYELDPMDRVKIQGILQKYTTSAISSTINLSSSVSKEQISSLYLTAWELGCKGITAYVDGSRDGILVSNGTTTEDFFSVDAPKRPRELDCDIYTCKSKGIYYNVIIGLYEGKPYEVFATKDLMTKERHRSGKLIRVKRGHYMINGDINRDHLMENMSDEEKIITRSVSALLRHRAHVKFVVDTLYKFPGEDLHSFNKLLARILKKYIEEGETITGDSCDNCGSSDLVYKDGCSSCQSCGMSRCS